MSEYIKVAVDAMGGDYAPQEPVKGVVEALREEPELYKIVTFYPMNQKRTG